MGEDGDNWDNEGGRGTDGWDGGFGWVGRSGGFGGSGEDGEGSEMVSLIEDGEGERRGLWLRWSGWERGGGTMEAGKGKGGFFF